MKHRDSITQLYVSRNLRVGKNATITVVNADSTESTINLPELAALDGIAAADLAKIDGITNGAVAANKAVVVDTNKDASSFRNLGATNLDAGASGTAGSVDVFPTTAAKGKLAITCTDQTGDTTVSVVAGAMAAARTLTIPDPGAAASFMMTEGAQTINGVQTYTLPRVADHNTGITAFATGGQASATALTGEWNNITTCATAGDSVKLPAAVLGQVITVKNSGAATLAVFPATGDAINALAVNLSVDVAVSSELTFRAIDATTWETCEVVTLPAPSTQKGSLVIQAADSAGNTITTITNASQAAARTYTIPDAGGNASFVMSTGIGSVQTARCSTQFNATSGTTGATLTDVVGMDVTVIPGTYRFRINLSGVSTINSGLKVGFHYVTTVLSSIEVASKGYTASAVAVQQTTTATELATLFGSTTAVINCVIDGSMVVTTGGTISVYAAQNAAHADTTSVYVGSTVEFVRIA